MKKITCTKCGCKDAADFVVKILCPESGCKNYDKKLADERIDESIDELSKEIDFYAGNAITSTDIDWDDFNLGDLDDPDDPD